jgi:hypothetical protein
MPAHASPALRAGKGEPRGMHIFRDNKYATSITRPDHVALCRRRPGPWACT